ncbi:MAG: DUF4160 domain-containing protein [Phreatobacter sp.]
MRIGACRVVVYPDDHRPSHVHLIGHGYEPVFQLNCPDGPVALREHHGFPRHELGRFRTDIEANLAELCRRWRIIHGAH